MKLRRALPLKFEFDDGSTLLVESPTIAQMEQVLALDPAEGEERTLVQQAEQLRRQLEILLGDKAARAGELTYEQARQVLQAIFAHIHGIDPQNMLALQAALKKNAANRATKP